MARANPRTRSQPSNSKKFQQMFGHLPDAPKTSSTSAPLPNAESSTASTTDKRKSTTKKTNPTKKKTLSTTSYIGQTCQPKSSDYTKQALPCERCGDLNHRTVLCTTEDALPTTLYCKTCKIQKKTYTSNSVLSLHIELCPAHVRDNYVQAPDTVKMKDNARYLLDQVYNLQKCGIPLPDAIIQMGLTTEII